MSARLRSQISEIYIGEADVLRARLDNHYANREWFRLIAVTATDGSLNKAHVKYLESRLLELASKAHRATILNDHPSRVPQLNEVELFKAEQFLSEALPILRLVGINAFSPITGIPKQPGVQSTPTLLLSLDAAGVKAYGYIVPEGFLVTEASGLPLLPKGSLPPRQVARRQLLIDQGKFAHDGNWLRLSEPTLFNSPSAAASLLHGWPANGLAEWHDGDHTLKQVQERDAAS